MALKGATMELKIGDVVQLKSGGPLMVVQAVFACHVSVLWMDAGGELNEDDCVPIACVILADKLADLKTDIDAHTAALRDAVEANQPGK
jgi:uncharacterized protein YodC (DUF2158 family)